MKGLIFAFAALAVLAGCKSTSVITEYDKDGKITRTIQSEDSIAKLVTESTKNKTVIAWESGWAAYMSCSTATTDDPTPTVKMFAGKADKGWISALPGQQNWSGIAEVVNATKYDLSVSTSGVGSTSAARAFGETESAKEAAAEPAKEAAKESVAAANGPTADSAK